MRGSLPTLISASISVRSLSILSQCCKQSAIGHCYRSFSREVILQRRSRAVLKEICCGARLGTSLHCTFTGLKIQSNIRARGRIEQKNKCAQNTVEEYAWLELVQSGNIKKLLVSHLERYLKHYKLSSSGTKADKIGKISLHVLGADEGGGKHADDKSLNKATEMLEDVREGENEESSSEDDIVLAELIEASDCDSEQGTAGSSKQQDYSLHASDKFVVCFSE